MCRCWKKSAEIIVVQQKYFLLLQSEFSAEQFVCSLIGSSSFILCRDTASFLDVWSPCAETTA